MKDEKLRNLLKILEKDGMIITDPDKRYKSLTQKKGYETFFNRRNRKTIIINKKKLRKEHGFKL